MVVEEMEHQWARDGVIEEDGGRISKPWPGYSAGELACASRSVSGSPELDPRGAKRLCKAECCCPKATIKGLQLKEGMCVVIMAGLWGMQVAGSCGLYDTSLCDCGWTSARWSSLFPLPTLSNPHEGSVGGRSPNRELSTSTLHRLQLLLHWAHVATVLHVCPRILWFDLARVQY